MNSANPIPILCSAAKLLEKSPFSVSAPSPLLPSPASLQLAQLQAQLTLHRLKLAQTAVTNNPAAATVLNQVLSKVAMSQPLFNQLRHPSVMGASPGHSAGGPPPGPAIASTRFSSGGIAFPAQSAGGSLGPMQAQAPNAIVMSPFGGVMAPTSGQQPVVVGLNKVGPSATAAAGGFYEYSKQNVSAPQGYASEGDQSGFPSAVGARYEGPFGPAGPLKHDSPAGFQKDAYGAAPAFPGDPHSGAHPKGDPSPILHGTGTSNQWENIPNFSSQNKSDLLPSDSMWPSASQQPYEIRNELYNPEEPTPDTKFSTAAAPAFGRLNNSKQSFGSPRLRQNEELSTSAPDLPMRSLQPHELNDLHGVAPLHFPHVCSLCDKKIFDLKVSDFNAPRRVCGVQRGFPVGQLIYLSACPSIVCQPGQPLSQRETQFRRACSTVNLFCGNCWGFKICFCSALRCENVESSVCAQQCAAGRLWSWCEKCQTQARVIPFSDGGESGGGGART